MIRLFGSVLLCILVNGESVPYRPLLGSYPSYANPNVPVNPVNPGSPLNPYTPGRNPYTPGYNPHAPGSNPYTPGHNPYAPGRNPYTPGHNPYAPGRNPYTPGHNPYAPGSNPLGPGYNNPYYNAGAAVPILSYSNERGLDGSYSYSYSSADGKQAQERGFLKDAFIDNKGEPQGTQVVEGSYAYISPEGTPIQVSYVADENGFRPSGVHIPADGKGVVPFPGAGLRDPQGVYDPRYNHYNPQNYRNPHQHPQFGQYNNFYNSRPYDPRFPYDPKLNLPNAYRPWGLNEEVKEYPKKDVAAAL